MFDIFSGLTDGMKHFSQFMIIRLDQKRMILQYVQQQILGGIHCDSDSFSGKRRQNPLINVFRQCIWNTARQNQHILFSQSIQFLKKSIYGFLRYDWPLTVNLCLVSVFDLYIDS